MGSVWGRPGFRGRRASVQPSVPASVAPAPPPAGLLPVEGRGLATVIFLTFFSFYLVTSSREQAWGDANPVYQVAQNLVAKGSVATDVRWPADAEPGRAGKYYAYQPILGSLVHVPGAALRSALNAIWPDHALVGPLSLPWAVHLGPAALGALVCVMFFGLCRQHGLHPGIASIGTLMLGLATGVWVYARSPFTEIVQTACFNAFLLQLVRTLHTPTPRAAAWMGLWAGLLLNAKVIFAVALPGPAVLLAWTLRRDPRLLFRVLLAAGAAMIPGVALALYYNWLRFEGVFNAGYNTHYGNALFERGRLWIGLWGLLLSPGKSVFLYSPPLLLALWGWRRLFREHRKTFLAFAAAGLPVLLLYGKLVVWHGDWSWGPRYITCLLPLALFPLCLTLEALWRHGRRRATAALATGALAVGGFVQVLGVSFYWDTYIRLVVFQAAKQWLGQPNVSGAIAPDRGGFCDGCFETMHAVQYLPQFQPIVGHFWLLKHVPFGHDWVRAEKDAPWHPETTLALNVSEYNRGRLDWWILDYRDARPAAAAILTLLLGTLLASAQQWWRSLRRFGGADVAVTPSPPAQNDHVVQGQNPVEGGQQALDPSQEAAHEGGHELAEVEAPRGEVATEVPQRLLKNDVELRVPLGEPGPVPRKDDV